MKLIPLLVTVVLLSAVMTAEELALGSKAPLADQKMEDISGTMLSLNDAAGKEGLLVIFSCNTCPWVLAWEDRYVTLAKEYIPKGIGIVAVNSNSAYRGKDDSIEAMRRHADELGYNFYYTVDKDSKLATAFGATRTPHIYLFDKSGKLVYRGAIDDNAKQPKKVKQTYLADAIDAMLAGKEIKETSTKALGCSIKFASKD